METIAWTDFERIELIVGTIVSVKDFPEAKKPTYKLMIDLGPKIGIKKSRDQITKLYSKENLLGQQVICVANLKAKKIGLFIHSEQRM